MDLTVTNFIIFSTLIFYNTDAVGIDDKLDFGNERQAHTSFIGSTGNRRGSFLPVKHLSTITKVQTGDELEKIGVVCVSEGCNTTTNSNENSDGNIKTDIVVHVETNVNLNNNKSKPIDDTPDIPIVVGTDSESDNYGGIRNKPKSVYIPNNEPNSFYNNRDNLNPSSNISPYGSLYPPDTTYPFHMDRRIDSTTAYYNKYNLNPMVDINFKSSPRQNSDMFNYKSNGIEVSIPYFDQSFHNHQFGETPPPPYLLYPKNTKVMNPVEFKVMRTNWKPSFWQNQFMPRRHSILPIEKPMKCYCENDEHQIAPNWQSSNRRSNVYFSERKGSVNDPGSQINDKLAPLN